MRTVSFRPNFPFTGTVFILLILAVVVPFFGYQVVREQAASVGTGTPSVDDPQGLADGVHALFVNGTNPACSDTNSHTFALNPATPWCSPRGMNDTSNDKVNDGDVVYVRTGDYHNIVGIFILTNNVTISGYPGETTTISGSSPSNDDEMFSIANADGVTFNNLNLVGHETVTGGRLYLTTLIVSQSSDDITIRDSTFSGNLGNDDTARTNTPLGNIPSGSAIDLSAVNGLTVDNIELNCIDDLSRSGIATAQGDGLQCDSCQNGVIADSFFGDCPHISVNLRDTDNITVRDNDISNRIHTGLGLSDVGNPLTSANNTVIRNIFNDTNLQPSEATVVANAIQLQYTSSNAIYNNVFNTGHNEATAITLISDSAIGSTDNNEIYNNTIYRYGQYGINLSHSGVVGPNAISGNKIYNNIIALIANPDQQQHSEIRLGFTNLIPTGYGNEFKNNLLYTSRVDGKALELWNHNTTLIADYTPTEFNSAAPLFAADNVGGDPLFEDADGGDFQLASGSPAIAAGLCLAETNEDFNGDTRDSDCNIGAYDTADVVIPPAPVCGNNLIESGEICDGSDLDSQTCQLQGFDTGTLTCAANCLSLVTNLCLNPPPDLEPAPPTPPTEQTSGGGGGGGGRSSNQTTNTAPTTGSFTTQSGQPLTPTQRETSIAQIKAQLIQLILRVIAELQKLLLQSVVTPS